MSIKLRLLVAMSGLLIIAGSTTLLSAAPLASAAAHRVHPTVDCTPTTVPRITSVSRVLAKKTQTITITGTCFGRGNTFTGSDNQWFQLTDETRNWNGCHIAANNYDSVTCTVTEWTNHQIVFSGYTGEYGSVYKLRPGNRVRVSVWNLNLDSKQVDSTKTAGNWLVTVH